MFDDGEKESTPVVVMIVVLHDDHIKAMPFAMSEGRLPKELIEGFASARVAVVWSWEYARRIQRTNKEDGG